MHLHLCVCLFLAKFLFLMGVDKTDNQVSDPWTVIQCSCTIFPCSSPLPYLVPSPGPLPVSWFSFCWCDKNHNKNNLSRTGFISAYTLMSQFRESKRGSRGHGGKLLTGLFLLAYPVCFLTQPRATIPETVLHTMIFHLSASQCYLQVSLISLSSISPVEFHLCQVDRKLTIIVSFSLGWPLVTLVN